MMQIAALHILKLKGSGMGFRGRTAESPYNPCREDVIDATSRLSAAYGSQ